MSVFAGPEILSDSLIFSIDAVNPKSYPGTGNTWIDLSGKNNHLYLINSPTFQNTHFSNDGLNDYHGTSGSPNNFIWTPGGTIGNSTITIDMWVRSSDTDASGRFFSKPWNGSGQYNIAITPDSFYLSSGTPIASNGISFGRNISNGTWTNIVCWADSTNMGYYLNGDAFSGQKAHGLTSDAPSLGNSNLSLTLMTMYPYGQGWAGLASHNILGDIASCKMYSRVLTQNEVLQNFNASRSRFGI